MLDAPLDRHAVLPEALGRACHHQQAAVRKCDLPTLTRVVVLEDEATLGSKRYARDRRITQDVFLVVRMPPNLVVATTVVVQENPLNRSVLVPKTSRSTAD